MILTNLDTQMPKKRFLKKNNDYLFNIIVLKASHQSISKYETLLLHKISKNVIRVTKCYV